MNAAQAQALFDAEKSGVRQIAGEFNDLKGGLCAMGVLQHAFLDQGLAERRLTPPYSLPCPLCGAEKTPGGVMETEAQLIVHFNDVHQMTFSEIARKLGPDSV